MQYQQILQNNGCSLTNKQILLGQHGERLLFPKVRLQVGRKAFSYFRPALYNELLGDTKECNSSKDFKGNIKGLLCMSVKLVSHNM